MVTTKAKRLRKGKYLYRGYIITCVGYYNPEQKVVWEAEEENGDGLAHAYSLKDTKKIIDELIDKYGYDTEG